MPTYEYECTACGERFEVFQSFKEDPVKVCPKCGGEVKRLVSGSVNFIFKGSGFYLTENRSEDYKKKAKEETAAHSTASSPAKTDTSKTETKSTDSKPAETKSTESKTSETKKESAPSSPAPAAPSSSVTTSKPSPPKSAAE